MCIDWGSISLTVYTSEKMRCTCNFNFFYISPLFKKGFLISLHFIHTIDRFVYNRCKFLKKQITVLINRFVTDCLQNFVRFITSLENKAKKSFLWTLTNRRQNKPRYIIWDDKQTSSLNCLYHIHHSIHTIFQWVRAISIVS